MPPCFVSRSTRTGVVPDVAFVVRRLEAVDIPDCEAVLRSLPEWFGIEAALREYVDLLAVSSGFVAIEAGSVVGFIALQGHFPGSAEVSVMAVRPERHRQGIGRCLLDRCVEHLLARGVGLLHVKTVGPSSEDACYARTRFFYEANGFEPVFESWAIWGGHPCLVLVRMLPSM